VGRAVRAIHTTCRITAACLSRVRPPADDGLRRVDDTYRPVASEDPHVPPSLWGDHGDAAPVSGTVSPARWRDSVAATIGLRHPDVPTDQKDRKTTGVHLGWLTAHFNTCLEDVEDDAVQRYARSCLLSYE
jgi:hypothetical protein